MFKKKATKSADDFEVQTLLGKGSFGRVLLVKETSTGKLFAMKVLRKQELVQRGIVEHTNKEREILELLSSHPFITKLYYAFQDQHYVYLIMTYMEGGSLFDLMKTIKAPLPEDQVQFYGAQILLALEYLHHKNVIFRDLKPENVLLDEEGYIRLSDFGLSAILKGRDLCHSFSGSAHYMAPEILTDTDKGHNKTVDIWAFGVLLFVLLTYDHPFQGEGNAVYQNIIHGNITWSNYQQLSFNAKDLLQRILVKDPNERLGCKGDGIAAIKKHSFFETIDWDKISGRKIIPSYKPKFLRRIESSETLHSTTFAIDALFEAKNTNENAVDGELFKDFSFVSSSSSSIQSSSSSSSSEQQFSSSPSPKVNSSPSSSSPSTNNNNSNGSNDDKDKCEVSFDIRMLKLEGLSSEYDGMQVYITIREPKLITRNFPAIVKDSKIVWRGRNGDHNFNMVVEYDVKNDKLIDQKIMEVILAKDKVNTISKAQILLNNFLDDGGKEKKRFPFENNTITLTAKISTTYKAHAGKSIVKWDDALNLPYFVINNQKYSYYDEATMGPMPTRKITRSITHTADLFKFKGRSETRDMTLKKKDADLIDNLLSSSSNSSNNNFDNNNREEKRRTMTIIPKTQSFSNTKKIKVVVYFSGFQIVKIPSKYNSKSVMIEWKRKTKKDTSPVAPCNNGSAHINHQFKVPIHVMNYLGSDNIDEKIFKFNLQDENGRLICSADFDLATSCSRDVTYPLSLTMDNNSTKLNFKCYTEWDVKDDEFKEGSLKKSKSKMKLLNKSLTMKKRSTITPNSGGSSSGGSPSDNGEYWELFKHIKTLEKAEAATKKVLTQVVHEKDSLQEQYDSLVTTHTTTEQKLDEVTQMMELLHIQNKENENNIRYYQTLTSQKEDELKALHDTFTKKTSELESLIQQKDSLHLQYKAKKKEKNAELLQQILTLKSETESHISQLTEKTRSLESQNALSEADYNDKLKDHRNQISILNDQIILLNLEKENEKQLSLNKIKHEHELEINELQQLHSRAITDLQDKLNSSQSLSSSQISSLSLQLETLNQKLSDETQMFNKYKEETSLQLQSSITSLEQLQSSLQLNIEERSVLKSQLEDLQHSLHLENLKVNDLTSTLERKENEFNDLLHQRMNEISQLTSTIDHQNNKIIVDLQNDVRHYEEVIKEKDHSLLLLTSEISQLQQQLTDHRSNIENLTTKSTSREVEIASEKSELEYQLQTSKRSLEEQSLTLQSLSSSLTEKEQNLRSKENDIIDLQSQLQVLQSVILDKEKVIAEKNQLIENNAQLIANNKFILQEYKQTIEENKRSADDVHSLVFEKDSQLSKLTLQLEDLSTSLHSHSETIILLQSEISEKSSLITNLQSQLDEKTALLDTNSSLLSQTQTTLQSTSDHAFSLQSQLNDSLSHITLIEKQLEEMKLNMADHQSQSISKLEELSAEKQRLHDQHSSLLEEKDLQIHDLQLQISQLQTTIAEQQSIISQLTSSLAEKSSLLERLEAEKLALLSHHQQQLEEKDALIQENSLTLQSHLQTIDLHLKDLYEKDQSLLSHQQQLIEKDITLKNYEEQIQIQTSKLGDQEQLLLSQLQTKDTTISDLRSDLQSKDLQIQSLNHDISELQLSISTHLQTIEEKSSLLTTQLTISDDLQSQLTEKTSLLSSLHITLEEKDASLSSHLSLLEVERSHVITLEQDKAHLQSQLEELTSQKQSIHQHNETLQRSLTVFESSSTDLQTTLTEKIEEIARLSSSLETLTSQYQEKDRTLLTLESSFNELQSSHSATLLSFSQLQSSFESKEAEYTNLQSTLNNLQSSLSDLQSSFNDLQSKYNDKVDEFTSLQSEYDKSRSEISLLSSQIENLSQSSQSQINELTLQSSKQQSEIESQQQIITSHLLKIDELTQITSTQRSELTDLSSQSQLQSSQITDLTSQSQLQSSQIADLQNEKAALISDITSLQSKYNETSQSLSDLQRNNDIINQKVITLQQQYNEVCAHRDQSIQQLEISQSQLNDLQSTISELQQSYHNSQSSLQTSQSECSNLNSSLQQIQTKYDQQSAAFTSLQSQHDQLIIQHDEHLSQLTLSQSALNDVTSKLHLSEQQVSSLNLTLSSLKSSLEEKEQTLLSTSHSLTSQLEESKAHTLTLQSEIHHLTEQQKSMEEKLISQNNMFSQEKFRLLSEINFKDLENKDIENSMKMLEMKLQNSTFQLTIHHIFFSSPSWNAQNIPLTTYHILSQLNTINPHGTTLDHLEKELLDISFKSISITLDRCRDNMAHIAYWLSVLLTLLISLSKIEKFQFEKYQEDNIVDKIYDQRLFSKNDYEKQLQDLFITSIDLFLRASQKKVNRVSKEVFLMENSAVFSNKSSTSGSSPLLTMEELAKRITQVIDIMTSSFFPRGLILLVIEKLFYSINCTVFNLILQNRKLCRANVGFNIKLALSDYHANICNVPKWGERLLEISHRKMKEVTEVANALVIMPNGSNDLCSEKDLKSMFPALNIAQIKCIADNYTTTRKSPEKIPDSIKQIIDDVYSKLPSPLPIFLK